MGIYHSFLNLFKTNQSLPDDSLLKQYSISYANRTEEQKLDETRLNELLPINIGGVDIYRLSWKEFQGKPNESTDFWAEIRWSIKYQYKTTSRKHQHDDFPYKIQDLTISVYIKKDQSWVKRKNENLLSHEQGHYLIGCLCALEFIELLYKGRYSEDYQAEIEDLFNQTLKIYTDQEKEYDKQTSHGNNIKGQSRWFRQIYENLLKKSKQFQEKDFKSSEMIDIEAQ